MFGYLVRNVKIWGAYFTMGGRVTKLEVTNSNKIEGKRIKTFVSMVAESNDIKNEPYYQLIYTI